MVFALKMKSKPFCNRNFMSRVFYVVVALIGLPLLAVAQSSVRTVFLPDSKPLHFQFISAGQFTMGSPESEPGRDRDEGPQKKVDIETGFYLGTYEVTQQQWLSVMHYNPAVFKHRANHLQFPVESVSWSEVQLFLEQLNCMGLGHFRLPTEAEWEYACRAGTDTRFYWGEEENWTVHRNAWANSRSMAEIHPVGEKPPNPWGLYDMSGNVWEWTSDKYQPYDESRPPVDSLRVFRGGSWFDFENAVRCANRHKHGTAQWYPAIGLRLVYEPNE